MTGCSDVITFCKINNSACVLCSLLHRRYLISKPHNPLITVCTLSQILFFYYNIDEYRHDASVISSAAAVPKIIQVGLRKATLKKNTCSYLLLAHCRRYEENNYRITEHCITSNTTFYDYGLICLD